ncbi:MAG: hypothetical protein WBM13_11225 [Bacteroidia bacterium]
MKNIEEIENYFEGKLSLEDKLLFEAKLEANPELVAEFELYKQIRGAIIEKGKEDLKHRFALADKELDNKAKNTIQISKKSNYKILAIAASVALVVGISLFFFLNTSQNYVQLVDKYYEKEKGLPVEMGTSNKFDKLMNAYKAENYTEAQKQLTELLQTNSSNDTAVFFNAIVNDELMNYPQAIIGYLNIPIASNYYEKSQYRLVLTYLKTNEKEKAIEILNQALNNKQHLYYDKLSQLRSELQP